MRKLVREHNVYRWAGSLIGELCEVRLKVAPGSTATTDSGERLRASASVG
jgi:hypothetical protein